MKMLINIFALTGYAFYAFYLYNMGRTWREHVGFDIGACLTVALVVLALPVFVYWTIVATCRQNPLWQFRFYLLIAIASFCIGEALILYDEDNFAREARRYFSEMTDTRIHYYSRPRAFPSSNCSLISDRSFNMRATE